MKVTTIGIRDTDGAINSPAGSIPLADPAFGGTLPDARLSGGIRSAASFAYRDNLADATNAIDSRIAGKTFSFTNLAGTGTANLFSTWNNVTHTFVRNPNCWAADIDLSCVSVANSANADGTGGNRGCLTLISPTQAVTNQHFGQPYQVGVVHDFVDAANNRYSATIVAGGGQVGSSDIRVVSLSPALPASIKPMKVLPLGLAASALLVGTPLLGFNQQKQAVVREFNGDGAGTVSTRSALASNRAAWTADTVAGDSDSIVCAIFGGTAYLLTTYTSSFGSIFNGPSYSYYIASVNAILTGGSSLGVVVIPALGAAALREVIGGPGPVPAIDLVTGKLPPSVVPATANSEIEQAWDGSADLTLSGGATIIRLTAPVTGIVALNLPTGSGYGRTVRLLVPSFAVGAFTGSIGIYDAGSSTLVGGVGALDFLIPTTGTTTQFFLLMEYGADGVWRCEQRTVGSNLSALSGKFAGAVIPYSSTLALDFNGEPVRTVAVTGDLNISAINGGIGKTMWTRFKTSGTASNLTFPSAWTFLNAPAPTVLAANKTAALTLRAFGVAASNFTATWDVQP